MHRHELCRVQAARTIESSRRAVEPLGGEATRVATRPAIAARCRTSLVRQHLDLDRRVPRAPDHAASPVRRRCAAQADMRAAASGHPADGPGAAGCRSAIDSLGHGRGPRCSAHRCRGGRARSSRPLRVPPRSHCRGPDTCVAATARSAPARVVGQEAIGRADYSASPRAWGIRFAPSVVPRSRGVAASVTSPASGALGAVEVTDGHVDRRRRSSGIARRASRSTPHRSPSSSNKYPRLWRAIAASDGRSVAEKSTMAPARVGARGGGACGEPPRVA
jgi:hypothetical protein